MKLGQLLALQQGGEPENSQSNRAGTVVKSVGQTDSSKRRAPYGQQAGSTAGVKDCPFCGATENIRIRNSKSVKCKNCGKVYE